MSTPLIRRLHAVRRKYAAVAVTLSAVAAVGLFASCLVVGMMLDRRFELSYTVRAALMFIYAAAALLAIVKLGLIPLFRPPSLETAARWVERSTPAFGDRLISAVHFHRSAPDGSPALVRRMLIQTESLAGTVQFTDIVRTTRLRRWATVVAVWVVTIGATILLAGPAAGALARRALLVPNVPFPKRTIITNLSGNLTTARGEDATLSATTSGEIPATGTVRLTFPTGVVTDLPLVPAGAGRFDRPIANVQSSFTYAFHLGDNQTDPAPVTVVVRPAVVDVQCSEILPAYTGRPPVERSTADLSLLKGSRLVVRVTSTTPGRASAEKSRCAVHFIGPDVDFPLVGSINDLKQMHAVDGAHGDVPVPPGTTGMSVTLVDDAGVRSADGVVYKIDLHDDGPPRVRLTVPVEPSLTATPVAKIAVSVDADDDFAVGKMSIRYRITRAGAATAEESDPHGLTATYFPSTSFDGTSIDRPEPTIDRNWATDPPPPGTPRNFGVRWTGFLRPMYSEPVVLLADFSDGVKIWLDDQLVLRRDGQGQADATPVPLVAGRAYSLRVEAPVRTIPGTAKLGWRSRRVQASLIPHDRLLRVRPPAPSPDVDALVGLWTFDDPTPGFVHDPVGGATGVVVNATRAPGVLGQAIRFDHPNANNGPGEAVPSVVVASTPAMQFGVSDSFTLQAWVDAVNKPDWQAIVTKGRDGPNWYGLWIDDHNRFATSAPNGFIFGPDAAPGWHLVAITQDGKTRTLVVDGKAAGSLPATSADGWGDLLIGTARGTVKPLTGLVDDVRLYGRALSVDELRAQLEHPKPAVIDPITATDTAATVPIDIGPPAPPAPSVHRDFTLDLTKIPTPPAVGDTIEFWVEAVDTNDVTGPGVGASEHRTITVISPAQKQKELMERLGDYLGEVHTVSESQKDLKDKVDTIVGPKR